MNWREQSKIKLYVYPDSEILMLDRIKELLNTALIHFVLQNRMKTHK